jgi:hypothetical protein
MLRRIAALYAIEAEIRGRSAETRLAARRAHALPIVTAMEPWLREQLENLPGKFDTARAIQYALKNWAALCTFLEHGRIELDTNTVERDQAAGPDAQERALRRQRRRRRALGLHRVAAADLQAQRCRSAGLAY